MFFFHDLFQPFQLYVPHHSSPSPLLYRDSLKLFCLSLLYPFTHCCVFPPCGIWNILLSLLLYLVFQAHSPFSLRQLRCEYFPVNQSASSFLLSQLLTSSQVRALVWRYCEDIYNLPPLHPSTVSFWCTQRGFIFLSLRSCRPTTISVSMICLL